MNGNRQWLALLVAVGMLSGCGLKADLEPNNEIALAQEIMLDKPFGVAIYPQGDLDWFKVKLPEAGYLKLQATAVPEDMDLEAVFGVYEEWAGGQGKMMTEGVKMPAAVYIPQAGTYSFLLHDNLDNHANRGVAQIKATFVREFDPGEPNNGAKKATPLALGQVVKAAIFPAGEQDWYKVRVEKQGYLKASAKNVPEGLGLDTYYCTYDEWRPSQIQVLRDWHPVPNACFVPAPGDYYVVLHDNDNHASEQGFEFKVEYLDEMDGYEPNHTLATAKEVRVGETFKLAIFPLGDQDYFRIKATQEKMQFLAKPAEGIGLEIMLGTTAPDDPQKMIGITEWKGFPAEFTVQPGMQYYFVIRDNYDNNESESLNEVRVE